MENKVFTTEHGHAFLFTVHLSGCRSDVSTLISLWFVRTLIGISNNSTLDACLCTEPSTLDLADSSAPGAVMLNWTGSSGRKCFFGDIEIFKTGWECLSDQQLKACVHF